MHELDADPGAVGLLQDLEDAPQRRLLEPEHVVEEEFAIEVGLGEPVGLGVQLWMVLVAGEPQRVEIGEQVSADAIGANQHHHPQVIDDQSARTLTAEIDDLGSGPESRFARAFLITRLQRRLATLEQGTRLRSKLVEVGSPARVDRGGIVEVAGVEVFDEGAVAAVQEGGLLYLASLGHRSSLPCVIPPARRHPAAADARVELTFRINRASPRAWWHLWLPDCRRR